ncbi:MAG: hypothetical protein P4L84_21465 [Isosphaeraceae bacterium]|nr:hypothetical protein [Isosphaeraceae bacterium]
MSKPCGWKFVGRIVIPGLTAGLFGATVWAQGPGFAPGPAPGQGGVICQPAGTPIRNAVRHTGRALQDGLIGYPNEFYEPPVGAYINANFNTMRAKANPHRFMLYRSDFLAGSNQFSPVGAARFNLMASRLGAWTGPVVIEWSPDEVGLAEARRATVVSTFQRGGIPVAPDRVVIAPTPYTGGLGADSANYYNIMISRDATAPSNYTYSPTSASGFGGGGGGGSSGGGAGPR